MVENKEIVPGKGIGKILLGMKMDEVEKILGKPDDFEKIDYEEGDYSITWYYYDLFMDLTFESDDDERLSFISVEGEDYQLFGKIRIGDSKESVLSACLALRLDKPIIEDLSSEENPNQELIALENENINLWFTDGILDEIQFGPLWEDDETPLWPYN